VSGTIVAVGHVGMNARDLEGLARFYRDTIGLRESVHIPGVIAIFEVGTTDLFIQPGASAPVEFDLAADDVDGLYARLAAAGVPRVAPKDEKRSGHRAFSFTDLEGNEVHVVDAHPRMRD
jgi:catechol 2,3-dioxygenase-like lactoylglutathione lyase family enzyme